MSCTAIIKENSVVEMVKNMTSFQLLNEIGTHTAKNFMNYLKTNHPEIKKSNTNFMKFEISLVDAQTVNLWTRI